MCKGEDWWRNSQEEQKLRFKHTQAALGHTGFLLKIIFQLRWLASKKNVCEHYERHFCRLSSLVSNAGRSDGSADFLYRNEHGNISTKHKHEGHEIKGDKERDQILPTCWSVRWQLERKAHGRTTIKTNTLFRLIESPSVALWRAWFLKATQLCLQNIHA